MSNSAIETGSTVPSSSEPRLLRISVPPMSDYIVFNCLDCGHMTSNEYLGTTFDRGVISVRITCKHCELSDVRKLMWVDWKGLPRTPDLDESSLLGASSDDPLDSSGGTNAAQC